MPDVRVPRPTHTFKRLLVQFAALRRHPRPTLAAIVLCAPLLHAQTPQKTAPLDFPEANTAHRPAIEKTMFPEVRSMHQMVGGGNNLVVEAGLRILNAGGNAVDAGVAATLAAAVT